MASEDNLRVQFTARLDEFVNRARSVIATDTPTETYQFQCQTLDSRMQQEIGRIREDSTPLDYQKQTQKMMQLGIEKARLIQEHKDTFPAKQKEWLQNVASAIAGFSNEYLAPGFVPANECSSQGNDPPSESSSEISRQARGSLEDTTVDPRSMVSPLPESSQIPAREATRHLEAEENQNISAPLESNRPRRASTMNKRPFSETPWFEPVPRTVTTIPFDDVYQDGQAEIKYTIIECEHSLTTDASVKGRWWILRCEEHVLHYAFAKRGNRSGPTRHLLQTHGEESPDCETNRHIDVFGVLVLGCTAELAKKNNDDVEAAISNGYDPKTAANSEPVNVRKRRKTSSENEGAFGNQPILDPEFGKLYMARWGTQMFAVALLPLRKLSTLIPPREMGVLMKAPPKCYNYDKETGLLSRWAPGFEDGGPKVKQRTFPVRCFDNTEDIGQCSFALVKASSLHELDMSRVSPQYHAVVQEYEERFLERDARFNDSDYSDGKSDASRLQTPEPTENAAIAEQLQSEIPCVDPQNPAPSTNSALPGRKTNGSSVRKSRGKKRKSRYTFDDDSVKHYTLCSMVDSD